MNILSDSIEIVWNKPAYLGEGPTWHPIEKKLYWLDITKGHINCLDIQNQTNEYLACKGILGSVVPQEFGGLLATLNNQIIAVDFKKKSISNLLTVFPDNRLDLRMNDGKCDAAGRFWLGVATTDKNKHGMLCCYDVNGTLMIQEEDVLFSNGMTWNVDNTLFYYVDTNRHVVYQYDFDLDRGKIKNRRIFCDFAKTQSKPDGLTIDEEGFLWLAIYGESKILRISPTGKIQEIIKIPIERPTSCIFGGLKYDSLFVTSCSRDLHEGNQLSMPSGCIFRIRTSVKGVPVAMFKG